MSAWGPCEECPLSWPLRSWFCARFQAVEESNGSELVLCLDSAHLGPPLPGCAGRSLNLSLVGGCDGSYLKRAAYM